MTTDILKQCRIEGMIVKLPEITLDRKEYLEVKKQLELIGGKWKGGKTQGFVFEQHPKELLEAQANGEGKNLKKEFQFFATPNELALEMALELGVVMHYHKVLEPSAGDGALIKALLDCSGCISVDCFEAMELNRIKISKVEGANLIGNDFLLCDDRIDFYDYIIANPPFTKNQDVLHICKMYECLKPGGSIVTMSSQSWLNGTQQMQKDFNLWLSTLGADIKDIEQGVFKDAGTMVGTLMIIIEKPLNKIVPIPKTVSEKLKGYAAGACNRNEFEAIESNLEHAAIPAKKPSSSMNDAIKPKNDSSPKGNNMKGTDNFKTVIQNHLNSLASKDSLFSETLKKPNKNIDDCISYILNTVQKSGCSGFADEEIFNMAVHYYDEDNIDVGKPITGRVVVNHSVELTEEEIQQARQLAIEKVINSEKEKITAKKVIKKQEKQHQPQQAFLFD